MVGYANDIPIVTHGLFKETVRERMQESLDLVIKWAKYEGLRISPEKFDLTPFANRRNLEELGPLRVTNTEI